MNRAWAIATLLLVAACGSTSSVSANGSDAATKATTPQNDLTVTAIEFGYDAKQWTVPAGKPFTVHFRNQGTIEHEWSIIKLGRDIHKQSEFGDDHVLTEVEKITQETVSEKVITITKPGRYQILCGLQGHFDAGMHSVLNVV